MCLVTCLDVPPSPQGVGGSRQQFEQTGRVAHIPSSHQEPSGCRTEEQVLA